MISEEKLQELEERARTSAHWMAVVPADMLELLCRVRWLQEENDKYYNTMMKQNNKEAQLWLEAEWLAHKVASYYQEIDRRCNDGKMTDCRTGHEYWRNEARKAVQDD